MTQCNSGHFYDETKFSACPYCPALGATPVGKTVPAPPGGGGAMESPGSTRTRREDDPEEQE